MGGQGAYQRRKQNMDGGVLIMRWLWRKIKEKVKNNGWLRPKVLRLSCILNPTNKWRVSKGNTLQMDDVFVNHCSFQVQGEGNTIKIEPGTKLRRCSFHIHGNYNMICIGANGLFLETEFHIEDDNNVISVGDHACFCGKTQLASIEGTKIEIGRDCLFSSNIQFRTGDSHSIVDNTTGGRINPSADITIGDHVWVGANVICLKGVHVDFDCVIGTAALLTRRYEEPGCIIAGVPASIIKKGITWQYERT